MNSSGHYGLYQLSASTWAAARGDAGDGLQVIQGRAGRGCFDQYLMVCERSSAGSLRVHVAIASPHDWERSAPAAAFSRLADAGADRNSGS